MNLSEFRKSCLSLSTKGRDFCFVLILAFCVLLNLLVEFNKNFLQVSGIFSYNNLWHRFLVFLTIVISLSIFLLAFLTYPQVGNYRMLIAGYTFLAVGLLDSIHVLGLLESACFPDGNGGSNQTMLLWVISRFINVFGFTYLTTVHAESKKTIKRRYLSLFSLLLLLLVIGFSTFNPASPVIFVDAKGLTFGGLSAIATIALLYVYILYRSVTEYRKTQDGLYKVLAYAFLFMFFSEVSIIGITRIYDLASVLSHVYQFACYSLLFNAFYIQAVKRPYVLLSQAKEELNEYLSELDKVVDQRTTELRCMNEKLMADMEIARGMQLSMLPRTLPQNEFVSFASGYIPAEKLSGDFYNVFKIDDIRYGICIGDVSGHGVSAAMLSIFSFQKIQSLMEETGSEGMAIPSVVLQHLYDSFNAANFSEDMYIVMLYGVFNIETGIFSYASGGLNTSPLRIRPDGSIQELDNEGFAILKLGDLVKPKFANHQVLLFPGDKLVLYTDGLVDARNHMNETYSVQRLKNIVLRQYKWGAERLSEAIVKDISDFTNNKPADDITVLIVDVLPPF